MGTFSGRLQKPYSMIRILSYASVSTCVVNLIILTVCLIAGRWVFGDAMCQIFAFFSHVMVGGAAWMVALTGLERYYKLFLPGDHQCVFSDINTRILVFGLYLLVAVIMTSPLYGWGEFTEYRGYFHLTISLVDAGTDDNYDNSYTILNTSTAATTETCAKTGLNPEDLSVYQLNITHFTKVLEDGLTSNWGLQSRLSGLQSDLTYLLRARSLSSLDSFMNSYAKQDISRRVLSPAYRDCDCLTEGRFLCKGFSVNLTEVEVYKNIYLPFQGPMMCSVDFTSANKVGSGWLAFFVLTTAIMPYGLIFILTVTTVVRWNQVALDVSRADCVKTWRLLLGACVSVLFYAPYFVLNIMNSYGMYVSTAVHTSALVSYFSCSLVPCLLCIRRNCHRQDELPSPPGSNNVRMEDIEFELLQTGEV